MTPEQFEKVEMKKLRKRLEEKSKTITALEQEGFQLQAAVKKLNDKVLLIAAQRDEAMIELAGKRVTQWVTSGDIKRLKDSALDELYKEVSELRLERLSRVSPDGVPLTPGRGY